MIRSWNHLARVSATAFGLFVATPGWAASLQQVTNWNGGVSGLPSDVSMYVYVPDSVAQNPPILTLIHYCGGKAENVFGQASGGGIVKAADTYGFIMVVPSSGRCWDIVSDKTRKRDGGGDSHAIIQMVRFAITKYSANAARVYATGDSSGGMMTELLLAVYPDVFKAGSAFAGMPAGCRGANEGGNGSGYSGECAGGRVSHTPEEWGQIVRAMYPDYTGHRPRVQLFHGDADDIITYPNHTEAVKEWKNVLGLPSSPTSTDTSLKLGTHSSKRETWKKTGCDYSALDAFTSLGGDHGPSDALFPAQYVIPFLGLDKTGATDPEVAQCGATGTGGTGGTGGGSGTGGSTSTGGTTSTTGGSAATGGTASTGGSLSTGGNVSTGGTVSTGGSAATGGNASGGVSSANGGSLSGAGGIVAASGGSSGIAVGGAAGTSVSSSSPATGGATSAVPAGGTGSGTLSGAGGGTVETSDDEASEGCSCSVTGSQSAKTGWLLLVLGAALGLRRRARRAS